MVTEQLPDHAVLAAHVISITAILGTFAGFLPPLAALMAMIWYAIQVYESRTVQKLIHGRPLPPKEVPDPPEALNAEHHPNP